MKLITLGCSFTEGQGLKNAQSECYTTSLGKKLNLEYYNFGAVGMSNDYIFRKIFELVNSNTITKDDIIVIQWTHYIRKELQYIHNNRNYYHIVPNSMHAQIDKALINEGGRRTVKNEFSYDDKDKDIMEIQINNEKLLNDYVLNFLNEKYQLNTTINYINSLYTYLEHFGYKHLHFFGWDECIIESVFDNKSNFIKESFGGYTNTIGNEHPDKKGHDEWADFLFKKLI